MSVHGSLAVLFVVALNAAFIVHIMMRIMVERVNARRPGSWSQVWNNPLTHGSIFRDYEEIYPDSSLARWARGLIGLMLLSAALMVIIVFLHRIYLLPKGRESASSVVTNTYAFNALCQIANLQVSRNGTTLQNLSYTFSATENNGQILSQTDALSGETVRKRQRRDRIVAIGEASIASATRGKFPERSETTSHAPPFGACDTTASSQRHG